MIHWLHKLDRANESELGNKAFNLRTLFGSSIQVPLGFCLGASALRLFITKAMFDPTAVYVEAGNFKDAIRVSRSIRAALEQVSVPTIVQEAIDDAYFELQIMSGLSGPPLAVRSSSTQEDGVLRSAAGVYDSFINVTSSLDLQKAIKMIWLSLWSPTALLYQSLGLNSNYRAEMGVVVQLMINPISSGVMFTADPVNDNRDVLVVNSVWGLGQTAVQGIFDVDTFVVDKRSGSIIKKRIVDKPWQLVPHGLSGTKQAIVPSDLRKAASITQGKLHCLYDVSLRIEKLFEMPQDIEWCFSPTELFVLQSRPITTLVEWPTEP